MLMPLEIINWKRLGGVQHGLLKDLQLRYVLDQER
jgi:hypothetical protein